MAMATARTRFKKSDLTRARILDSAAYVLSTRGYARMRMSDVAEHAEIHGPTAYYHFESRDALVVEVLGAGVRGMRESLERALVKIPDGTPALDRILVAVDDSLRYCLLMSHYPRASIRNSAQLPDELRIQQRVEEAAYGVLWKELLEDAATSGEISADLDLAMTRRLVLGAMTWTVEWWDFERGDVDRVVAAAIQMVRRTLTG